jgi:hypothetical protein
MVQSEHDKKVSLEIDAREGVVRLDMAIGLSAIAKPFKHKAIRGAFDITRDWKGDAVNFKGVELNDNDMGIMLALMSIAQKMKPAVHFPELPKPKLDQESDKETSLIPHDLKSSQKKAEDNAALQCDVVTIDASFKDICDELEIKSDSSAFNKVIRESVARLATIVVTGMSGSDWAITHLIENAKSEDMKKSLRVTLSYRLTYALIGSASYGAVDMKVFNKLPHGAARILYVWIVCWFGAAKKARVVGLNKLVCHAYGIEIDVKGEPINKKEKMSESTLKDRRRTVRHGLKCIQKLSNILFEYEDDNVIMVRK